MQYAHAEDPAFLLEYPSSFPSSSASLIDQEQLILGSEVEMAGSSRTTEDGVSVERESADHSFAQQRLADRHGVLGNCQADMEAIQLMPV